MSFERDLLISLLRGDFEEQREESKAWSPFNLFSDVSDMMTGDDMSKAIPDTNPNPNWTGDDMYKAIHTSHPESPS